MAYVYPLLDHIHSMKDKDLEYLKRLESENQRLRRAVDELSVLNELASEIGASVNSEEVIRKVISRSLRAVHAEQGTITLVGSEAMPSAKTLVRSMVSSSEHQPFHLTQALLGWMFLNKKPLVVNNPRTDKRFSTAKSDPSIRNLLCVPLLVKSDLIGILTVYNKKNGSGFIADDQRLLTIIAAQSAQVVENARLYEEEKAYLKVRSELMLAKEIQMDLLPKEHPEIPGYDIAGYTRPAQDVGGDYYDFIQLPESKLVACLGDVSGKMLPAALLMSNLQATIRGQSLIECRPKDCLARANDLLYHSTAPHKFATFFYGLLDAEKHLLRYSNAGHDRPQLFSPHRPTVSLEEAGVALSFIHDYQFSEGQIVFQPGEVLFIYSDGVSEAMNESDEDFGVERILSAVDEKKTLSAKEIIANLVSDLQVYAQGQVQSDDITMIVIKRK